MSKYLFVFLISSLILSACQAKGGLEDASLFGSWVREGTYLNDVLEHETPATIIIEEGKFSSVSPLCMTWGSASSQDGRLTVKMTDSDCTSPLQFPFVLTYDYTVSEDGQILNLINQGVREEYHQK